MGGFILLDLFNHFLLRPPSGLYLSDIPKVNGRVSTVTKMRQLWNIFKKEAQSPLLTDGT